MSHSVEVCFSSTSCSNVEVKFYWPVKLTLAIKYLSLLLSCMQEGSTDPNSSHRIDTRRYRFKRYRDFILVLSIKLLGIVWCGETESTSIRFLMLILWRVEGEPGVIHPEQVASSSHGWQIKTYNHSNLHLHPRAIWSLPIFCVCARMLEHLEGTQEKDQRSQTDKLIKHRGTLRWPSLLNKGKMATSEKLRQAKLTAWHYCPSS